MNTERSGGGPQSSEKRAWSNIESSVNAKADLGFNFGDDCLSWEPSGFKSVQVPGGPQLIKCNFNQKRTDQI